MRNETSDRARKRRENSLKAVDVVEQMQFNDKGQIVMTSLQIAEITGKRHADVMRSIRVQEKAWKSVFGVNFAFILKTTDLGMNRMREDGFYALTKEECLYIATKFNDEARAQLIMRWMELEKQNLQRKLERKSFEEIIDESRQVAARLQQDIADGKYLPNMDIVLNDNDFDIYCYLRNGIKSAVDMPFSTSNAQIAKAIGLDKEEVESGWQRLVEAGYIAQMSDSIGANIFMLGSRIP